MSNVKPRWERAPSYELGVRQRRRRRSGNHYVVGSFLLRDSSCYCPLLAHSRLLNVTSAEIYGTGERTGE